MRGRCFRLTGAHARGHRNCGVFEKRVDFGGSGGPPYVPGPVWFPYSVELCSFTTQPPLTSLKLSDALLPLLLEALPMKRPGQSMKTP